ncbi:MAG: hypothetical protein P4M14_12825 [Gammaproteobacteria bacterium]|nr:hypothetical protein [Gammaproteobacteria bacterium]
MIKKVTPGEFFTANLPHQFLLLFFFIIVSGCGSLALGQDISWDLLNYHFYNGYAFLHHRLWQDVAPAMMQTYLNPYLDVLNYAIISISNPRMAVFLLGINSAIIGFFLYKTAIILFSSLSPSRQTAAASFSVYIGMTGVASVSLLGTATNDVNVALLIVVAVYCLLKALATPVNYPVHWIMVAAFLAGSAVGFKLTAATYVLGLLIGLIVSYGHSRECKKSVAYFILFSILGFVLVDGHWMWMLYQHFQNPFFPYYNNIFHSVFAPYVSFNLSPAEIRPHWQQYIFFPYYVAVGSNTFFSERALRDPRMAAVFIMTIIAVLTYCFQKYQTNYLKVQQVITKKKLPIAWRFVVAYFCVSYVAWLLEFAVYRYLLPLELLTGIIIVYLAQFILPSVGLRRVFLSALLVVFVMSTHYPDWGRMKIGPAYFTMNVPRIPPHSIVVIAAVPLAYTIPFFSEDTRFIGMTFVGLGEDISLAHHLPEDKHRKLLKEVMTQLIQNSTQSPIYSLTIQHNGPANKLTVFQTIRNNKRTFAILRHFDLIRDEDRCQTFSTNMGDILQLCPLRKT